MFRSIILQLLYLLIAAGLCRCQSDKMDHLHSANEIKSQVDSIKFNQTAFSYGEGKQLFSRFCNTCHPAPEKQLLDQYLFDNLFERLPPSAEDYFISYLSDSKTLKASGNEYAKLVDATWDNEFEHHFKDSLTRQDFSNLITYIKMASKQRYQK